MICVFHPNAHGQDATILFALLGSLANPIGMHYLVTYETEYLLVGIRATFYITPHIVMLWLTQESGGIVIQDRLILK